MTANRKLYREKIMKPAILAATGAVALGVSYTLATPATAEVSILYNNFTPPSHPITRIAKAWSGDVTTASNG